MSSAYITTSKSEVPSRCSINPLMIMFQRVGPATDPWGQPFAIGLVADAFPRVKWEVRSYRRKLLMNLKMFAGQFQFQNFERIVGCHLLSKALVMSSASRQHFCRSCLHRLAKSVTAVIALVVDFQGVKPNCWVGTFLVVSRKKLRRFITSF